MSGRPFRFDRRTYLRAMAALPAGLALGALGSEHVHATPSSFTTAVFPVGAAPRSLVVGDVNKDGIPDLLVANFNDQSVNVLLNDGTGHFTNAPGSPITFPSAQRVRAADISGDGKLDMLALNGPGGELYTRLGNGDGTFGPIITSNIAAFTTDVAPILLTTSGNVGLVVTVGGSTTAGANTVQIFSGNGAGTFTAKSQVSVGTGSTPIAIAVSYDGGQTFIATANYSAGTMSLFKLQSDDSLTQVPGSPFTVGTQPACFPSSLTFGRFGGPGTLGLACANYGDNTFSTFLLPNGGLWGFVGTYPTGQGPYGIAAGDGDGDGEVDLFIAEFIDNVIAIHPGNGNGTFGARVTVATGLDPADIALGDFNRDGKPDIVTANQGGNNVTVAMNTTTPFPHTTPFFNEISPLTGSSKGGTPFTIKGSGFKQGATVQFGFGIGVSFIATGVVVSPDGMTITGVTPNVGPVGLGPNPITIINPDGASSKSISDILNAFIFMAPPTALPGMQPVAPVTGVPNSSPPSQPTDPIPGAHPNPLPGVVPGGGSGNIPRGGVPAPIPTHR